jgi:hypothetical protein
MEALVTLSVFRGLSLAALLCAVSPQVVSAVQAVETATPALQSARLKVSNRPIIDLRGPIAGYSAFDRVTASSERIEKILESESSRAIELKDAEDGKATQVLLAGKPAFLVTQVDINTQAGETTQIVAREAAKRLETAVREWGEQRTPRYLAVATGIAAGATLIFVVLAWLIFRINRWFGGSSRRPLPNARGA